MHTRVLAILAVVVTLLVVDNPQVVRGQAALVQSGSQAPATLAAPLPSRSPLAVELATPTSIPSPTLTPVPTPLRMAELVYNTSGGTWWTFDDCERPYLPGTVAAIVAVLRKYQVTKVTFFMNGDCYESRPDLVEEITSAGFEIGNHAYQHIKLSGMRNASVDAIADQIRRGPPGSKVFRPPYWDASPMVRLAASLAGYSQIIMTSVSTGDSDEANLCQRVLQGIGRPGPTSIVTMHMTNRETPKALEAYFSGKGCQ